VILDIRERLRFMEYCKQQAESAREIADQMEKMMSHAISDTLAKRERQKAAAYSIVAMDLASIREDVSVSGEDVGEV